MIGVLQAGAANSDEVSLGRKFSLQRDRKWQDIIKILRKNNCKYITQILNSVTYFYIIGVKLYTTMLYCITAIFIDFYRFMRKTMCNSESMFWWWKYARIIVFRYYGLIDIILIFLFSLLGTTIRELPKIVSLTH